MTPDLGVGPQLRKLRLEGGIRSVGRIARKRQRRLAERVGEIRDHGGQPPAAIRYSRDPLAEFVPEALQTAEKGTLRAGLERGTNRIDGGADPGEED